MLFWLESGIIVEELLPASHDGATSPCCMYAQAASLDTAKSAAPLTDEALEIQEALAAGASPPGSGAAAAAAAVLQAMAQFEPYVLGILLSTGGLPLDRLHTMLQRFVVSPKCAIAEWNMPVLHYQSLSGVLRCSFSCERVCCKTLLC
jgi:hypothetical protein